MRTLPWRRDDLIESLRSDVWRYLSQASTVEEALLEASALLQVSPESLRDVGALQFLSSRELGHLLEQLPLLVRQLATTTEREEEWNLERVRGAIQWGKTIGLRGATGLQHAYVTAPARRAFQTPENEILVAVLDATVELGRRTSWHRSTSDDLGMLINQRVATAERWRQSRMLVEVERRDVTPNKVSRVRTGRHSRRYENALATYLRFRDLVRRLDRDAIRDAVEKHGLVHADDATLFELHCTFLVLKTLPKLGWATPRLELFRGGLQLTATRENENLDVVYQRAPKRLAHGSAYRRAQELHDLRVGALRPDLVLCRRSGVLQRWILVEVKGGERDVAKSARAALIDLLAYRTAFAEALHANEEPYGLGIAWGAGLTPDHSGPVALCTPDTLPAALASFLA